MSEHILIRQKLRGICNLSDFYNLINRCVLSDEEKRIIEMHYIKDYELSYIGDILGYSESTMKRKHCRILKKIGKVLGR